MLQNVAAVILDGVNPFELGVVCEVFGTDRSDDGLPVYDFAVASAEGPSLTSRAGFSVQVEHGLERLESADLIAVPAGACYESREFPPELLDALRRGVDRGRGCSASAPVSSWSLRPGCSTAGAAPCTGITRRSWRRRTRA